MGKEKKTAAASAKTSTTANSQASKMVQYMTPFKFSGETREVAGHIYRFPNKADFYAFRSFADSLDGFTLRYNQPNEVLVWEKKLPNEPMHIIKVFGIFVNTKENPNGGATTKELYDLLHDSVFREKWDEYRQEAFRIVSLSANTDIGYYAAKSPMPLLANRDFVNQRMWHEAGRDEYVIFNTSVPHSQVPSTYQRDVHHNKYGQYIRAISKLTGYLICPWRNPASGEVEGASLTYITQTDPGGWIPASLTNFIATKFAPNTMRNVAQALPKFRTWFKEQLEAGTYTKDWDLPQEWWTEDGSTEVVKNETIEFAIQKWSEGSVKK
ncbi:START domain containing protein, putative [Leishmania lindenbergi]|uniref:START domain containing protein n=1 Tax=Leishmania lindenbergi TaxID=651832 RepID=A0AAW3ATB1_9TRYP